MLHIGGRNKDALIASEAAPHTDVEKTLDLVVNAADGLHLPELIDRASDGKALRDGHFGQRRDQRVKLGGRGAVAVNAAIGLLEDEAGAHGERNFGQEGRREIARENEDALGVNGTAKINLALDIDRKSTRLNSSH